MTTSSASTIPNGDTQPSATSALWSSSRWRKQAKLNVHQTGSRPRGGRTSKVHAVANAQGRPLAFVLTPGNIADISVAATLLGGIATPRRLLADKAYDVDHLRQPLEAQGTGVVIPSNGTRRRPYPLNRPAYRRRNLIERMFGRMKDWRCFATRYDRLARNFLSTIAIVATACFWLS
ncbi:IS5 family transposase [Rhodovarius crocodyli]|uniref:IS5 family transposase n=1 Tax=Rhodovarius crocodyli TaxID=1979269 RepID=A0A437LV99_9PROT|nr:IS5 family transposase [Rhodovarius crocodyli]RVT89298.1 IS5 family transposase [Rhodovarius crocodyli]